MATKTQYNSILTRPLDGMIAIYINGEPYKFTEAPNCTELIMHLQLAGRRVAIERNGEIVPRSRFSSCQLTDGDRLEIVAAVGGG
jgi:sulfur carrier protein